MSVLVLVIKIYVEFGEKKKSGAKMNKKILLVQSTYILVTSYDNVLFFLFFSSLFGHDNQPGEAPREGLEKLELILVESCVRVGSAHGEVRHRLTGTLLRDRERATQRAISRLDASMRMFIFIPIHPGVTTSRDQTSCGMQSGVVLGGSAAHRVPHESREWTERLDWIAVAGA